MEDDMTTSRIASVSEVICASTTGFDDAIKLGFERAKKTLRGITGMRVLDQSIRVENEEIVEYRVRIEVIFILDD
jgi:flavin-binding protein dodecin